ncbi:serine/threonine protein kinase [Trichocoleus sp. FACHB-591]|uniref:serine/threonine-protein kinase n=1 Tax=Trichocoleus sp. FACHB-591 TaxID=2692872 RepID=UPI00168431B8|nr:serine/threonine-protein kinase [Trichocoleus sp. FACHB-591]MBD2097498.1 serine/threonine protein kinase [Trichocoleus sp. FACHB-591]
MRYCLNPVCRNPHHAEPAKFCETCGFKLVLGDRYCALEPIGQGGFGRTFLALDDYKPSKPRCVIKQCFPLPQSIRNPIKAAELFRLEAVRLEELGHHPQIPELLAYFQQDQFQYLIQEFIDGATLEQEVAQNGVFNETQIRQLLSDLLPVLQFVHEHHVIHRDIKPTNIIRRRTDQQLVLVDFGAAKSASSADLSRTGTSIGSPAFVSPEQAMGKAIFASDLYSLGVTCIYLLTHTHPSDLFDSEEGTWLWQPHLKQPISGDLGQILDRLLQSATKKRYQSAIAALQDLQAPALSLTPASNRATAADQADSVLPSISEATPSDLTSPTWRCVRTLTGHSRWVRSLAISPDSRVLVSGSGDRTVKIWDLTTGQLSQTLLGHEHWVRSVAISPDGELVASASNDKTVKIWQLSTGKLLQTLSGHSDWVRAVTFSPDSQYLASGSQDKSIKLWQVATGQLLQTLVGHEHWVLAIALATGTVNASTTKQPLLVSGSRDTSIKIWQLNTQRLLHTLTGHDEPVTSLVLSSNGQLLVSGSQDKTIKVWQLENQILLRTLTGHADAVNAVTLSPDGQLLVSGSQDKTIKVWQFDTGTLLETLVGHVAWIWSVAISADGQTIASAGDDGSIKIWQRD